MSDSAVLLVRAVARAFADARRVLLCGADLETLQLLAEAEVKELVAVFPGADPKAPAGQTATGAPLKLRPDYRERANSKDLVVDPTGDASADDVLRLLKKQGVYLAGRRGPALEAFTHVTEVEARQAAALVAGHSGHPRAVVLDEGAATDVRIFLGAMHAAIAPPAVLCAVPGGGADAAALQAAEAQASEAQAHLVEAMGRFDQLEAQVREAESDRDAAMAAAGQMHQRATAAEAALDQAELAQQAAESELVALRDQLKAADALKAEHAELQADYDTVRAELAERRVADKRADALKARFDQARAGMAAEVAALKSRLRAVDEAAADVEGLLAERDAVRSLLGEVLAAFGATLAQVAPGQPAGTPPPVSDAAAVHAWLSTAAEAANRARAEHGRTSQALAALQVTHETLGRRARELGAAVTVLQAEAEEAAPPAAPPLAPADEALRLQVEALEQALAAERKGRAADRAAWQGQAAAAQAALADRDALRGRLADARRAAARAELGRAGLEEVGRRLERELSLRTARTKDLQGMLQAHEQMHALLNSALAEAEERRVQAEAGRRMADENLQILRAEFERRGPGGEPATAQAEQRGLRAALLEAEQRAADAERRAAAATERVKRLTAERAARG